MRRLHLFVLSGLLLLGVLLAGGGLSLWSKVDRGPVHRFYSLHPPQIPAKGYFSTWGVEGSAGDEPDEWNFYVIFEANTTADIVLTWNVNQSVLFERNSAKLNETFVVALPRTNAPWRWDWVVRNPHDSGLAVENFTVIHYSITYPERSVSLTALGAGIGTMLFAVAALVHITRRGSPPK
jgi:hypothetical protein